MRRLLQKYRSPLGESGRALAAFGKWCVLAILTGAVVGGIGAAFLYCINAATAFRTENAWMIWLLPAAGAAIVLLYRKSGVLRPQGTDLVLQAVRSPAPIPFKMAPLIFISTVLTHLFGGSAGREGAALQMGGSLGYSLGCRLGLDEKDRNVITMCGMAAAFTALFGAPLASTVFAMEVTSVGVMYYAALVPCALASLVAAYLAGHFGCTAETHVLADIPALAPLPLLRALVLAMLCAALSMLFCKVLRKSGELYRQLLKNDYLRAAVGGALVAALTLVFGRDYLGAGMQVISAALDGMARPEAFALKLLFTALTLGAGFKGGEIVPGFFVGATFGCVASGLLGLPAGFGAALGMLALFCGVTNCPLSTVFMGMELFGMGGAPYFLIAAAVSYMLSGYSGLYSRQKILYSKYKTVYLGEKRKS